MGFKRKFRLTTTQKIIGAISIALVIVALFFIWTSFIRKPRCRITFDPQNGSKVTFVKVNSGASVRSPETPMKDGYKFAFWSEDGNDQYDFSLPVTRDITLKAVYFKVCKVDFLVDGTVVYTEEAVEGGKVLTPAEIPEKDEYVFAYWELNGVRFDFSQPVTRDIQLTAHFTERIPCIAVSFKETPVVVGIEEIITVSADSLEIHPAECTDIPVFSIDDDSVASLSEGGRILGVSAGQTTIRVKCGDIETTAQLICASPVEFITLDRDSYTLEIGESVQVKTTIEPSEAAVYKLQYYVDDANIAFVDEDGIITGRQGGFTKLTVTSFNGILVSANVYVNGSELVMSGLPSTFFTSYDPSRNNRIPVSLVYREWKDGVEITDAECAGALLQCSLDVIKYKDGCIYQSAPVEAPMSSEVYFTYMTSKSNSCYVVCEPTLAVKSTENLDKTSSNSYKIRSKELSVTINMNCTGSWEVIEGAIDGYSSEGLTCTFTLYGDSVLLRYTSDGGQIADIRIS